VTPPVRVGTAVAPDGARLSWRVDGAGPVALVASNGVGVSTCFWRPLAAHFALTHSFVTWDYRAHGQSPLPPHPEEMTVAQCARDLWTVLAAAGFSRAVLLGHSMGAQVILEAYRQRPEAAQALLPMLGAAGQVLPPLLKPLLELGQANAALASSLLHRAVRLPGVWEAVRALRIVHPDLCPRAAFEPYFDHLAQLDLRGWFALARDLTLHDASDVLSQVRVPTLVVAGERDLFTPLARSQEMAQQIPGAELLLLRQGSHAALVEQPELIALAVERFLRVHHLA
jgi:pimeloyl-ACP methyl ester carboxylesterase